MEVTVTKQEKLKSVAEAFMKEDPDEYAGESLEDVIEQISQCSDSFIDNAYKWYCAPRFDS